MWAMGFQPIMAGLAYSAREFVQVLAALEAQGLAQNLLADPLVPNRALKNNALQPEFYSGGIPLHPRVIITLVSHKGEPGMLLGFVRFWA